jgi:hypothetical protein
MSFSFDRRPPAPWRFADPDLNPAPGQSLAQQNLDLSIGAPEIGRRHPLNRRK